MFCCKDSKFQEIEVALEQMEGKLEATKEKIENLAESFETLKQLFEKMIGRTGNTILNRMSLSTYFLN